MNNLRILTTLSITHSTSISLNRWKASLYLFSCDTGRTYNGSPWASEYCIMKNNIVFMPVEGWENIESEMCQQGLAGVCLMKMACLNASCQAVALFIVTVPGRWRRVNGSAGLLDVIISTTSLWNMDAVLFWYWMGERAKRPRIIEYERSSGGFFLPG